MTTQKEIVSGTNIRDVDGCGTFSREIVREEFPEPHVYGRQGVVPGLTMSNFLTGPPREVTRKCL